MRGLPLATAGLTSCSTRPTPSRWRWRKAVTEEQWLSCNDWRPMIAFLAGKISKRKGTFYVCAGLHCISHLLYDEGSWTALEIAERAADGLADDGDIGYADW